jgi:UDP-glucose 4-epimerase
VSEAIALALAHGLQGVFNVVGPGQIPLHTAIEAAGGRPLPLPELVMRPLLRRLFRWGVMPWPEGVIDYLKFPVTLAGQRFVDATGFHPLFGLEETLGSLAK